MRRAPLVVALGLLLSMPALTGMLGGQADLASAVGRVFSSMIVAWVAVRVVGGVFGRYMQEAEAAAVASPAPPGAATGGQPPAGGSTGLVGSPSDGPAAAV